MTGLLRSGFVAVLGTFGVTSFMAAFGMSTFRVLTTFVAFMATVTVLLVQNFDFFPLVTLAGNACDKQASGEEEGSFHLGPWV